MTLEAGKQFGHYKIHSLIGAGGMGEVFLAEDSRLRRRVALKVLPENIAADKERLRRFEREAFAASSLSHPNILTIYEFGADGETHFLASEFVKGETLREKMRAQSFDLKQTLDVAVQIASALEAAHEAGIIHRDIKPENVMIRADGYVKVLDFGLAKLVEQSPPETEAETRAQTQAGMVMGTAAYMSPEQARGQAVDARTDIFSFGCVLYEMLTRKQPFAGETVNHTIVAILEKGFQPVSATVEDCPAEMERIVNKCLAKATEARYQSARDLHDDLRELKEDLHFRAKLESSSAPNKQAEAETQIIRAAAAAAENETRNSIAVLPFVNMSAEAENEYFCDGLAEELLNALAKIDDLKVAARTSAFSFKNKNVEVGEIGNALNVKTVLEGSVRKSGNRIRITVQLVNAADGYHLWSERYDRQMQDIFDVQDEITLAVVDALKVKLFGTEKADLLKRYTDNAEAYEFYLKGLYYFNKDTVEGWLKAIESFQKAVEKEPEYALAYAGMSSCWTTLHIFGVFPPQEIIPKWRDAASRALEIDDLLGEAHFALAEIFFWYEWNWTEAEREYRRAVELNPNSAVIHQYYGFLLASRERFDEAVNEGKRAIELDPLSLIAKHHLGWSYLFADRADDTLEQIRQIIELDPNYPGAYWQKGAIHLASGEYEEAAETLQKSLALGGTPIALSKLGCAYGLAGKRDEALGVLRQLLDMRERQHTTAMNIARVYAGLGETEKAFEWLEKAVAERDGEMVFFKRLTTISTGESWGKNFRADPRYLDILRRVGLPTDEIAQGKTTNEASEAQTAMLPPVATNDKEIPAAIIKTDEQTSQPNDPKSEIRSPKSKWWLFGLAGLVLLTSAFFAYRYFAPNNRQIESIAVLPFTNESGNADVEYLSDGMTETLISSLSQLPNLNVKARSSVFRYKGKDVAPPQIGTELNVQAILNGVVVQRGQDLILNVELIDAQTENVLWSQNYNRRQTDLISLQNEIARDVSQKLKTKLSGADEQRLAKNYTENAEAYKLYLQGRFYWNKRTAEDFKKAIEYFNQALKIDSNYALAYTGLSDSYALLSIYDVMPSQEVMPLARESVLKAIALDDKSAEAHASLGQILHNYDYDFAGAERRYRRAIELNPNYASAHQWYGELLANQGRFEDSFGAFRRALDSDPVSPAINRMFGWSLVYSKKYQEGISQLKKAVELSATYPGPHHDLFVAYLLQGNYAESVEEFIKYQELLGNQQNALLARESFVKGGWQFFLRTMTERHQAASFEFYFLASLHMALGVKAKAIEMLDKSYEKRENTLIWLKVDPRLDPLRDDPRFEELLRRVGFPQ